MKTPNDPSAQFPAGASSVQLSYAFDAAEQRGAELHNSLFELLRGVREAGSIRQTADTLGYSYRYVWGALHRWEEILGEQLVVWMRGQPAHLTDFAERLLWAELRARKRMQPHIEALRADLARVVAEARDGRNQVLTVHASHDLALPRLREHASQSAALHLDIRFHGSIEALKALNAGRCLVAGFHVPVLRGAAPVFANALKPLLKPGVHKLIGCSRRTQGLMLRHEHAGQVRSITDLAASPLRFVNRQVGSGTRLLMDHLVHEHGLEAATLRGYNDSVEETHVAVAASIASGIADVGLGVEAAAIEFGLDFVPLIQEDYFIACLKPNLEHPAVQRLREILAGDDWVRLLQGLPGYAPAATPGAVLAMTKVLPWWHYRSEKPSSTAKAAPRSTPVSQAR